MEEQSPCEWKEEEFCKPPFQVAVLAWNECGKCVRKEHHMHNCLARPYPIHGAFIATYNPPDLFAAEWCKNRGDKDWELYAHPSWSPTKPKYWKYIESPYEMDQ